MARSVVILTDSASGVGGASAVALQSAQLLHDAGVPVRVFAGTGPIGADLPARVLSDSTDLMKAPVPLRATRGIWNGPAAQTFLDYTQDLDPAETIVHVHYLQFQLTASVFRAAADRGFRMVMTAHDYGLACPYSGFLNYNTGRPCGKRALSWGCATTLCNASRNVPGKVWHVLKGAVQKGPGGLPARLEHLACVSEFSRAILSPYLPSSLPTSVLRNPIYVKQQPLPSISEGAPFLFVGRFSPEKGGEGFAKATRTAGVPARMVGSGPEEARIRATNPDIEFMGWRTSEEVQEMMRGARALVFPSICYESMALVVHEALAIGLPVITSRGGAATEAIEDGVTGMHFDPGDVAQLSECLRRMDPGTAGRMGREAHRRYWQDPSTPECHLRQTLALYETIWGGHRG